MEWWSVFRSVHIHKHFMADHTIIGDCVKVRNMLIYGELNSDGDMITNRSQISDQLWASLTHVYVCLSGDL